MLLAKTLDEAADVEKAGNQTISFHRLGDAVLSMGEGSLLDGETVDFYMLTRRGIAQYVFPVGDNGDMKARRLAFPLSDDLLRRLVFCDFYVVETDGDAAFVEQLAGGHKIAAISIRDDALLGDVLFGDVVRRVRSLEELSPRSALADTPCLMPLSAKFIPLLSSDNIEEFPKLLLSLIPLFCAVGKPTEGEPRVLRVLHVLDEGAPWRWRYKGVPCKVKLSPHGPGNGRFLELKASLVSDADGSADDLFGAELDMGQLEILPVPFGVDFNSCGASIRVVDHHGELGGCINWDKERCWRPAGREQVKFVQGPEVDEGACEEFDGRIMRLPDAGFYGSGQVRLRVSDRMAEAELSRFDFSSGTPYSKGLAGGPCPSGDDGLLGLRAEFGRLLESMNTYCEAYQLYRTSMTPYFEATADCIGSRGPLRLFRFRSLSDPRTTKLNLEDIKQGRLFLARARDFNDLYDSYPLLDRDSIRERMRNRITKENMLRTLESDAPLCRKRFSSLEGWSFDDMASQAIGRLEKGKDELIESMVDKLGGRVDKFRDELRCVCLSEDVGDSHMWGVYADSGKGIAVEYELDPHSLRCYCEQKCESCMCATLAPVQYGERPDVSRLSDVLVGSAELSDYPEGTEYLYLMNSAFKKTRRWEHEREWRVVCGTCNKADGPKYLAARAKAIYLGKKIGEADRQRTIDVAEGAGIPLYEMRMTDDPTGRLAYEPYRGQGR